MIRVALVRAWPRRHERVEVELPDGGTVTDALRASAWPEDAEVAVYGERVAQGHVLADGDRIELLRPLLVDPKEARRRRATAKAR